MKLSTLIIGLALPLACTNAFADYTCKTISGTIKQLTPDTSCTIQLAQPARFADVAFIPSYCYTSTLTAKLDNTTSLTGKVYSGLTVNNISNGVDQATAASAIQIISGGVELGKIYTTDVIFDPYNYSTSSTTRELLTQVDGSRIYKEGKGHFEIKGNALASDTAFSGTLCTEN